MLRWERGGNKDWVYVNTKTGHVSKELTDGQYRDMLRNSTDQVNEAKTEKKKKVETQEPRGTENKNILDDLKDFNLSLIPKALFIFAVYKVAKAVF